MQAPLGQNVKFLAHPHQGTLRFLPVAKRQPHFQNPWTGFVSDVMVSCGVPYQIGNVLRLKAVLQNVSSKRLAEGVTREARMADVASEDVVEPC